MKSCGCRYKKNVDFGLGHSTDFKRLLTELMLLARIAYIQVALSIGARRLKDLRTKKQGPTALSSLNFLAPSKQ